jgi:RimJ/RimL family protein N-acetyltransferase
VTELAGERVRLRHWRDEDTEPWVAMNADPRVMEHFPSTLLREEAEDSARRFGENLERQGWGLWALEIPGVVDFAGFVGLAQPTFEAPFLPAVEIGWRLAAQAWGHGYASEGARLALDHAYDVLEWDEVVSFTAAGNLRSRAVMERLGMHRRAEDDFDHPRLAGSHLQRHVLYRLRSGERPWTP